MEHAHKCGETEEPRVGLDQHPLDLIHLRAARGAFLFRSLGEAMRHLRKQLELPVCHRLEDDFQRENGRRCIDFDVLRTEVPEVIWEYDRLVEAFGACLVSLWNQCDICCPALAYYDFALAC